jgi:Uracil DNA glycosylase superfamily
MRPAGYSLVVATWQKLAESASSCMRCDLYRRATATVFGEGRTDAAMVLVGEQPGDQEDKQGRPFVGPAGRVLDRALGDSGIDRADVYLTNAVKHFKWTARGKRRIHQRPNGTEIRACEYWLEAADHVGHGQQRGPEASRGCAVQDHLASGLVRASDGGEHRPGRLLQLDADPSAGYEQGPARPDVGLGEEHLGRDVLQVPPLPGGVDDVDDERGPCARRRITAAVPTRSWRPWVSRRCPTWSSPTTPASAGRRPSWARATAWSAPLPPSISRRW